jgi:hypothetical protein
VVVWLANIFLMKVLLILSLFVVASCTSQMSPVIPQTKIERQMVGLLQKFDRWDENGDGQLTVVELKESARISGHSEAAILEFYDTNQNGGISLKEAQAGYSRVGEVDAKH